MNEITNLIDAMKDSGYYPMFKKQLDATQEQFDYLVKTLNGIAMIASCAPNDDPELADQEFRRIMNDARIAVASVTPKS